jgi:hypothetical protein
MSSPIMPLNDQELNELAAAVQGSLSFRLSLYFVRLAYEVKQLRKRFNTVDAKPLPEKKP